MLHEVLRLRTWDEGALVAEEDAAVEVHRAEEMLERLAGGAAFHEDAEGVEFALAEGAVEFEVEVDALFLAKDVGEEPLGIEAGALDAVLIEVAGGGCDDVLDGFQGGSLNRREEGEQRGCLAGCFRRALGKWGAGWKSGGLCACSILIVFRGSAGI